MKDLNDLFIEYLTNLYYEMPEYVYVCLLIALCIGLMALLFVGGIKSRFKYVAVLLLIEYVLLVLCSTVVFRSGTEIQGHNFLPFWSYTMKEEWEKLLLENILNVLVFIPIGLLLGCGFRTMNWRGVMLIGVGLSVIIEVLQFVLGRGFSELDDVIHNTLGCMIGYGVYKLFQVSWIRFHGKRSVERGLGVL